MTSSEAAPAAHGLLLHRALGYDLLVWALTLGRARAFRERLADVARLRPGESVLDVGCGTGSLAVAAKRRVGSGGAVLGVDASPEMIARANGKARRAGVDVAFQVALAQALPVPDASFDVVLSTVMLHHIPTSARAACAREMRRVLRPGGRLVVVDFQKRPRRGPLSRLHRHGHTDPVEVAATLTEAGLSTIDRGVVDGQALYFLIAMR